MRFLIGICAATLLLVAGCGGKKKSSAGKTRKVARKSAKPRPAGADSGMMTHYMKAGKVNISYSADDQGSGLDSVEIWVLKDDAKKWEQLAVDKELTGKVPFEGKEEGTYKITSLGVDKIGNREKELDELTRPDFQIVVDRTAPKLSVTAPPDGKLAPADASFVYSWEATDAHLAENPVELQIRFKKNPTWVSVRRNLASKGKEKFNLPSARDDVAEVRFVARDRSGNLGSAVAGNVAFDRLAPVGKILAPRTAPDLNVKVKYTVSDPGAAELVKVSLWITDNNGRNWRKWKDAPNKSGEVEGRLPRPGAYGLALSASDAVGNRLLPPVRGTRPPFTLSTDTVPPKLEVSGWVKRGRVVSSRRGVKLKWKLTDVNAGEKPVSVQFSSDGGRNWTTVVAAAASTGSHSWKPSGKVNSRRCLLRVIARDKLGNESKAISPAFTVDNIPPKTKSRLEVIDAGKKKPVEGPKRKPKKKRSRRSR
jgi:hypothetical protein